MCCGSAENALYSPTKKRSLFGTYDITYTISSLTFTDVTYADIIQNLVRCGDSYAHGAVDARSSTVVLTSITDADCARRGDQSEGGAGAHGFVRFSGFGQFIPAGGFFAAQFAAERSMMSHQS